MNFVINSQVVLSRPPEGPLAPHIVRFAESLSEQGYSLSSLKYQVRIAACFSQWLKRNGVGILGISSDHAIRYLRYRSRNARPREGDATALEHIIDLLRHAGVIATAKVSANRPTPAERYAQTYERYLCEVCGLSRATIINYSPFICEFLEDRFGDGRLRISRLCAGDVVRFVQRQTPRLHLKRAKLMTTALRSFLRYVRYRGDTSLDLAAAVPIVANWSMSAIPRAIAPDQVRELLDSIDRGTSIGRRDYAILLLLARLGLRAGEVTCLELDDIDWDAGQLNVRGKRGQRNALPLPSDVGKAIAAYLQHGRPKSASAVYFCAPRPRSAAFVAPVAWDASCGIHSCAPASTPPPRAHTNFAMDWPPRCCAGAPRWTKLASC